MLQYGKPPVLVVIAVISLVYGWSILLDIPTIYAKDWILIILTGIYVFSYLF